MNDEIKDITDRLFIYAKQINWKASGYHERTLKADIEKMIAPLFNVGVEASAKVVETYEPRKQHGLNLSPTRAEVAQAVRDLKEEK